MPMQKVMTVHPVFKTYTLPFLAEATGYSVSHLRDLRAGRRPLNDKVRAVIAHKLNKPESDLFIDGERAVLSA